MKKIALLCLAAVFVIGIQSCSKDELPQDQQEEDVVVDKLATEDSKLLFCSAKIYVRYDASNSSNNSKQDFADIARRYWFRYVLVKNSDCPSVDVWYVPCDQVSPPKDKDRVVVDAENSVSISEGDAVPRPEYGDKPAYDDNDNTDYNTLCDPRSKGPTSTPISSPSTPN